MKKKLITIATDAIREAAAPFISNHRAYAARNNYTYECAEKVVFESRHPSFSKVPLCERALADGFDIVVFSDCDVAFLDQGVDLANLLIGTDYWLAAYKQQNWDAFDYLCAGLFVVSNGDRARAFFKEWTARCLTCPPHHPFEQWPFSELIRECDYEGIRCCTAQEIGSFAPEVWDDGLKFKRGFPTVHFAGQGKTMAEKADIFREKYAGVVY